MYVYCAVYSFSVRFAGILLNHVASLKASLTVLLGFSCVRVSVFLHGLFNVRSVVRVVPFSLFLGSSDESSRSQFLRVLFNTNFSTSTFTIFRLPEF